MNYVNGYGTKMGLSWAILCAIAIDTVIYNLLLKQFSLVWFIYGPLSGHFGLFYQPVLQSRRRMLCFFFFFWLSFSHRHYFLFSISFSIHSIAFFFSIQCQNSINIYNKKSIKIILESIEIILMARPKYLFYNFIPIWFYWEENWVLAIVRIWTHSTQEIIPTAQPEYLFYNFTPILMGGELSFSVARLEPMHSRTQGALKFCVQRLCGLPAPLAIA